MSRYVDISELEIPEDDCCYADLESFVEAICESEYIDIVRCSECKYAHMTYDGECKYCDQWPLEDSLYLDGDSFCSYGERKDNETTTV